MRKVLLACLCAIASPIAIEAQQDAMSMRIQRNCDIAEQVLRTAAPQADLSSAYQQIRMCGIEREGAVVATRLRRIHRVTDLRQLENEWALTRWSVRASAPNRVTALLG